jgi:eukaryotic-like serine/threonine-protein kinase
VTGWAQLKDAFFAAVEGDAAERARQVAALAAIDPGLARRLEALLAADDRGETVPFLQELEPGPPVLPSRIGAYEVVGVLGVGGMGEVYRARDARLQREVAIKVLPAALTSDRERLTRFEREAQVLASLNHPNVAQIYGLDESGGAPALVMELVPGPTLAAVIEGEHASLTLPRILGIARQIADGLDAAHEKGIIHRDLKPGNVVLTPEGQVKILDFGVAKSLDAARATGPAAGTTEAGMVLGTPAYMSPEQARGLPVDKRTDVWALGCVLYELLTGRQAFAGDTASDSLAAVLERQPDLTVLPAATPAGVRSLLRHCLEKDPKRRLRDIADARLALDEALNQPTGESMGVDIRDASTGRSAVPVRVGSLLAGVAIAALTGMALREYWPGEAAVDPPRRIITSVVLPRGMRLTGLDLRAQASEALFALSPDGRQLAMTAMDESGQPKLWVRDLSSAAFQPVPLSEGGSFPFWSPDSESLGFVAGGRLKAIRLPDGTPVTVADAAFRLSAWGPDNRILFTPGPASAIHVVPASGGTPQPVTRLDAASGEVQHDSPAFLPDGRHFLFFSIGSKTGGVLDPRGIYLGSLVASSAAPRLLVAGATQARYANGHLLFVQNGTLMAQPFDAKALSLGGSPFPLVEDVKQPTAGATGATAAFSVSADNAILAYQSAVRLESRPILFDRMGRQVRTLAPAGDYGEVALSPDGRRFATSVTDPARATRDLWIHDAEGGRGQRITFEPGDEFAPVWSPDGLRLLFSVLNKSLVSLYLKDLRTAGNPEPLEVDNLGLGRYAADWSRDGRHIVYIGGGRAISRSDLWVAPMAAPTEAHALVDSPFTETQVRIAPSSRWFAYGSNETGQLEVYVDRFEGGGAKSRVSTNGGRWPRWSRDGTELFYVSPDDQLMAVAIKSTADRIEVAAPRALFAIRPRPPVRLDAYPYDVMPDGQRFVVNALVEDTTSATITVVHNWTAGASKR